MTRESQQAAGDAPTRQRILAAALRLFGQYGYNATPIRLIAKEVGISDAAVLHHFRSKRAILTELWSSSGRQAVDYSRAFPFRTEADMREAVLEVLDSSGENFQLSRLLTHQALNGDEQAAAELSSARERWHDVLRHRFSCFEVPDRDRLADSFASSLRGFLWATQVTHGENYPAAVMDPAVREQAVAVVLRSCPIGRFTPRDAESRTG